MSDFLIGFSRSYQPNGWNALLSNVWTPYRFFVTIIPSLVFWESWVFKDYFNALAFENLPWEIHLAVATHSVCFTNKYSIEKKENMAKVWEKYKWTYLLSHMIVYHLTVYPVKPKKQRHGENTYSSPQTKPSGARPGRGIQAVILVQSNEK